MGTSQSSSGSPSGVPLIPPWVPDPEATGDTQNGNSSNGQDQDTQTNKPQPQQIPAQPVPLAPAGRFRGARRNLGSFARSGSSDDMHRGVGHYIRNGLGGTRTAIRRFGGTVRTASALYGALSATAEGRAPTPGSPLDPAILAGQSAQEVIDAVVEAVRPVDGTLDSEASREAIRNALADLLTQFPDADLLNLTEEERSFGIERYLALDVYRRFDLDVGKTLRDNAPSVRTALSRLKEVRDYIKENVAAIFRKLHTASEKLTARRVSQIVKTTLTETFEVFQEYV